VVDQDEAERRMAKWLGGITGVAGLSPLMVTVQVQLPEEIFSTIRRSPDEMAGEICLAAAVHWYSRGLISQERAAQLAGLDQTDFILALAREGVDAFAVDRNSLRRELAEG